MSFLRQTFAILHKDLLVDLRSMRRVGAVSLFGAMTLLLFSFAGGTETHLLRQHAAGYLWLALLLSSSLALSESFRVELEDDALEGLSLLPVDPRALYYGKALANLLFLLALACILLPLCFGLYGTELKEPIGGLVLLTVFGLAGLAGPGTLYAAMTSRARGRDVMLPLLLFPLVVPVLVAAVKGTALVFAGDPMEQLGSWLKLLIVFDLVYWSLCGLLFGKVVDS
ncbi:MAG: heme exporter protein CcmB [Myxococcota bacterium]|nr:heme exporter protein CcmB [Myxococcota bacterium]